MPLYQYSALTEKGLLQRGQDVAASAAELRRALEARGVLVHAVRRAWWAPWSGRAVKPAERVLFNQEFLALIRAGLTIPDALALCASRPGAPRLEAALRKLLDEVRAGATLSAACARQPEAFDALYCTAVRTGEAAGDLAGALAQYQAHARQQLALRERVAQALVYPAFLLGTLVLVLVLLFAYVLPRFIALYADFAAELPLATRVLVAFVDNFAAYGAACAVVVTAAVLLLRRALRHPAGQRRWDRLRERLPLIGPLWQGFGMAQLTGTLATLLKAGTPLTGALRATAEGLGNRALAARVQGALERVLQGAGLAAALRATEALPASALKMVEVGEATGRLDAMLAEVSQLQQEQLAARLGRVMQLVEPLLMLLIGVLIGAIIVVMYLPVFHLADVIR